MEVFAWWLDAEAPYGDYLWSCDYFQHCAMEALHYNGYNISNLKLGEGAVGGSTLQDYGTLKLPFQDYVDYDFWNSTASFLILTHILVLMI